MDTRCRVWTLWMAVAVTAAYSSARAQQPPAATAPKSDEAPVARSEDPAAEAILATNPSTPKEWVRVAKILADLDRPDLAKPFLKRVLDANLDQQQLVGLGEFFGAAVFTRMASRAELAPEAQQLADAVLAAIDRHVRDPARLADLVKQLQDPSAEVRYQAVVELQRARGAAVGPLVAVLDDPGRADEHANVRAALAQLGSDAVDPLIALVDSGDPALTVEAIRLLAAVGSEKAFVFLLAPATAGETDPGVSLAAEAALVKLVGHKPSRQEAAQYLARRAREYFDRQIPLGEDLDGQVEQWTWDPAAKQLVPASRPADDASLALAARLAKDAYSVAPADEDIRTLYLAATLEQAAYAVGLDKPLDPADGTPASRVAEYGPEVVETVLTFALESDHAPAAAAAARILGQTGKAETLLYQGFQPAPLVRATWAPDRRVRFAAVEAILRLAPIQPFPGSSRVTEALVHLAGSGGPPRAVVAGPSTAESQRVGGYLVALGYEFDTALTGRDALGLLLGSPDCELVLVDAGLQRPTVDFLLQQLRHDCRTAKLPVGLLARAGQLERGRHMTRNDALARAFSRPQTQEAVQWQVERLMSTLGRERVAVAERREQAAWAMKRLADLTGAGQGVFDLSRAQKAAMDARFVPELGPDAVAVLGNLGTPQCQQALVDLASRWTQPLELRLAAARAFGRSTERSGILLTTDQIRSQYDRYNQSENLDTGTQRVLGLILDYIEAPSQIEQQQKQPEGDAGGPEKASTRPTPTP